MSSQNFVRVFRGTPTQEHFLRDTRPGFISFMSAINQGKSASLPAKAMYNAQIQHPDINGVRHTNVLIIRGTQTQLLDTTVKAVREWLSEKIMHIRESPPIQGKITMLPCNDQDKYFPQKMRYRDLMGRLLEGPYLLGATKDPVNGLYRGGMDVSGKRIGDVFPQGTFITSTWRFMALDAPNWESDLLSTNFSFALIDEADKMEDLANKLPVIDGRLGRYPNVDVAPCTTAQIAMCYNPPDYGSDLEKFHRPGAGPEGTRRMYHAPAPLIKIDNPEDPEDFLNCKYEVNPDAEGLHFASNGAKFWLDKAHQFAGDAHYITRSLLGQYPRMAGDNAKRVYTGFQSRRHVRNLTPSRRLKLVVSCDWGNTPCAVTLQWDGGLRVFDEIYDDDMLSATFIPQELIPFIKSKYADYDIVITGDPSGSTITGAATQSLFDMFSPDYPTVENLTNDKEMRWGAVNKYLGQPEGFYIDPSCERLIEGFESGYVFDEASRKRGIRKAQKSGPKGKYSHLHDALQAGALYFSGGHEHRAEQTRHFRAALHTTQPVSHLVV